MCRTTPGPSMLAGAAVAPGAIVMLGEIFQPRPRSPAALAPVPSVARRPRRCHGSASPR